MTHRSLLQPHSVAAALAILFAATVLTSASYAQPGMAPEGTAIAEYNRNTGEVVVSVANVSNWYIDSLSSGFTGPDDVGTVLPLATGLVTNFPNRVGELKFGGDFTYTDISLGIIAATSLGAGDLEIFWNPGSSQPSDQLMSQPVVYIPPIVGQPGDFDGDMKVTGIDFMIWQRGDSPGGGTAGELMEWEDNYSAGVAAAASVQAVPEPTAAMLLVLGGIAVGAVRPRR